MTEKQVDRLLDLVERIALALEAGGKPASGTLAAAMAVPTYKLSAGAPAQAAAPTTADRAAVAAITGLEGAFNRLAEQVGALGAGFAAMQATAAEHRKLAEQSQDRRRELAAMVTAEREAIEKRRRGGP